VQGLNELETMLTSVSGETSLTVSAIILALERTPVEVSTESSASSAESCFLHIVDIVVLTVGESQDLVFILLQGLCDLLLAKDDTGNIYERLARQKAEHSATHVGAPPRGAPNWVTFAP
jgi:hypothetical protein